MSPVIWQNWTENPFVNYKNDAYFLLIFSCIYSLYATLLLLFSLYLWHSKAGKIAKKSHCIRDLWKWTSTKSLCIFLLFLFCLVILSSVYLQMYAIWVAYQIFYSICCTKLFVTLLYLSIFQNEFSHAYYESFLMKIHTSCANSMLHYDASRHLKFSAVKNHKTENS